METPVTYLPSGKFTEWRPGQAESLDAILAAIDEGKRFVVLSAPTGSGKSLSAMTLAQVLRKDGSVAILTNTKALQDQYTADFAPTLVDFRGKSNYGCPLLATINLDEAQPRPCGDVKGILLPMDGSLDAVEALFGELEADKSGKIVCPFRQAGQCDYYLAKTAAQDDDAVYITNYANYMGLVNNDKSWAAADTLILDEAHNLDGILEGYAELTISTYQLRDFGAAMPKWYSSVNQEQPQVDWDEWLAQISLWRDTAAATYKGLESRRRELTDNEQKLFRNLENLLRKFALLQSVKGGYLAEWKPWLKPRARKDPYTGEGSWHFRPFYPAAMAERLLYRGAKNIILMSATIEKSQVETFDIPADEYTWVEQASTFPAHNSRIFMSGAGIRYGKAFTFRNEGIEKNWWEWVEHLDKLLDRMKAKGHRTLVITPAARHVRKIAELSMHYPNLILHEKQDGDWQSKKKAIDVFRNMEGWCALVGAFDIAEGHSFDGAMVEATIFPKLWSPPDFNEAINKIRVSKDPLYNERRKAMWFAQAVGRGTRSATDINHILMMDYDADKWMHRVKPLLPTSVKERFYKGGGK